jgi:hypothetical protein
MMSRIAKASRILLAALREIFDESAYARFLLRTQMRPSREAYAAFWRERESLPTKPTKCC